MFEESINPIEERLHKRRVRLAVIVSLVLHAALLTVLLIFQSFTFEEEVEVITIRLPDKVIEEVNRMDSSQKEKFVKKQKRELEKARKQLDKKKKQIEKTREKEQAALQKVEREESENTTATTVDRSENRVVKESVTTTTTVNNDLIAMYDKKQRSEREARESEFITEDTDDTEDTALVDDALDELNELSSLLESIDDNPDIESTDGTKNGSDGGDGISWESGRARVLKESPPLRPPAGTSEAGLKRSLTIEFDVLDSGLISRAVVIETTGDLEIDTELLGQFKNSWKFEALPGAGKASGAITIKISY
jgi:outer membrane biosynthesis protein TonB